MIHAKIPTVFDNALHTTLARTDEESQGKGKMRILMKFKENAEA